MDICDIACGLNALFIDDLEIRSEIRQPTAARNVSRATRNIYKSDGVVYSHKRLMFSPKLRAQAPQTFLSCTSLYGKNGFGVRYRSYATHTTSNVEPITIMAIVWAELHPLSPDAARLNGNKNRVNPAQARNTPRTKRRQ